MRRPHGGALCCHNNAPRTPPTTHHPSCHPKLGWDRRHDTLQPTTPHLPHRYHPLYAPRKLGISWTSHRGGIQEVRFFIYTIYGGRSRFCSHAFFLNVFCCYLKNITFKIKDDCKWVLCIVMFPSSHVQLLKARSFYQNLGTKIWSKVIMCV